MDGPGERRLVIDRFEGDLAVVAEGGRFLDLPRWLLPREAGEGDVVVLRREGEGGAARIGLRVDRDAGDAARAEAAGLLDRLRGSDPGGDIEV